jgi:hypothetical protein
MTPMTAAAMGSVPVTKAGVGSGVLNTFRQVGGSLGIAVMGAILTSRQTNALASGASRPEAFIDGFSAALVVGSIIALLGAVTAAILIRKPAPEAHPTRQQDGESKPIAEVAT